MYAIVDALKLHFKIWNSFSTNSSQYIIVSSLLKAPQLTLFDYKYPDWSITMGYIIGFSSFMWIPIYMVYKLVWTPGSLKQVSE